MLGKIFLGLAMLYNLHICEKYSFSFDSSQSFFDFEEVENMSVFTQENKDCAYTKEESLSLLKNNTALFEEYVSGNFIRLENLVDCLLDILEEQYSDTEELHNLKKELVLLHLNQSNLIDNEIAARIIMRIESDDNFFKHILKNYYDDFDIIYTSLQKMNDTEFLNFYINTSISNALPLKPAENKEEYGALTNIIEYSPDFLAVKAFLDSKEYAKSNIQEDLREYYKNWIEEIEERDFSRLK